MLFRSFTLSRNNVNGVSYRLRRGGSGPAIMLLHGRPQTHVMWHKVAPSLTASHTVLCPDLHPDRPIAQQSRDLLMLASQLGHDELIVAGHDYGAFIACQMALDSRERVKGLVLLEALPFMDHQGRDDMAYSLAHYASCWFGQLHPKSEASLFGQPAEWLGPSSRNRDIFSPEAVLDYTTTSLWKGSVAAPEKVSLQPIICPLHILWGKSGRMGGWYDPLNLWRQAVTGSVTGHSINAEHFLPEENPTEAIAAFEDFLATNGQSNRFTVSGKQRSDERCAIRANTKQAQH